MAVVATKTASEVKDFTINWLADLGTDTITGSSWTVSNTSISITNSSFSSPQTTVWLSGGQPGTYSDVTNTITTAGGRTLTKTFKLSVVGANYL
jgi:hypothetical protein